MAPIALHFLENKEFSIKNYIKYCPVCIKDLRYIKATLIGLKIS